MRLGLARFVWPVLLVACGDSWGTQIGCAMPYGVATLAHSEIVDGDTARRVLVAMTASDYNFAASLPAQVDRNDGRLMLRLATDDDDAIRSIRKNRDTDPAIRYFEGLAEQVSLAIDGQPVDIVLCNRRLDRPVHTITWRSPSK